MSDIRLFRLSSAKVAEITGSSMALEKPLQHLFEQNLEALLGVRFLASEHETTNGRIDTVGLDENNCPVIIEYKRHSNENVVNQGLFYLDWLMDHQADFKLLVMDRDADAADKIDWSIPRLLCVAADFTRYDVHAVKQMGRNIELIRYRKFGDDLLMLELLTAATGRVKARPADTSGQRGEASRRGKNARKELVHHIADASGAQKERFEALAEFINSLGDDVQEQHLKFYIAYKRIKNFACVDLRNQRSVILVYVRLNPAEVEFVDGFTRDMTNTSHYGTGDVEITISSDESLERAKPFIRKSYETPS
ncbi:MAG: endonuclease NucS [Pirellulales bacterium]|nr:endonuclease NucS [Alphaproteobacteria bacterium]MDA8040902.1 endonuclease NucS [Pirellulales bacterium]